MKTIQELTRLRREERIRVRSFPMRDEVGGKSVLEETESTVQREHSQKREEDLERYKPPGCLNPPYLPKSTPCSSQDKIQGKALCVAFRGHLAVSSILWYENHCRKAQNLQQKSQDHGNSEIICSLEEKQALSSLLPCSLPTSGPTSYILFRI